MTREQRLIEIKNWRGHDKDVLWLINEVRLGDERLKKAKQEVCDLLDADADKK